MIVHAIGGKTFETVYAHLQSIAVKVGQTVKQGERIGVKGTTGNSTGIHLHFEVHIGRWNNKFTNAVDPLRYVVDPEVKQTTKLACQSRLQDSCGWTKRARYKVCGSVVSEGFWTCCRRNSREVDDSCTC